MIQNTTDPGGGARGHVFEHAVIAEMWYRKDLRLHAKILQDEFRRTESLFQTLMDFKSRRLRSTSS